MFIKFTRHLEKSYSLQVPFSRNITDSQKLVHTIKQKRLLLIGEKNSKLVVCNKFFENFSIVAFPSLFQIRKRHTLVTLFESFGEQWLKAILFLGTKYAFFVQQKTSA